MNSWRGGYCYHCHHKQLFHKSCVTVSYNQNNRLVASPCVSIISIWMVYHSYNIISIIHNFYSKILCHSLLQRKIGYFRLISTISTFIRDGYLHSYAAQRSAALRRATALDLRRRSWSWPLQLLYDHVLCVGVSMCTQSEVNITWLSRSSSAAQLTD